VHLGTQHAETVFQNNEKVCSLWFSIKSLLFEKEEIKINYICNVLQLYCSLSGVLFNYYLVFLTVKHYNSDDLFK